MHRTEYQKQYYQDHKLSIKKNYTSKVQYVKWTAVKKVITSCRRQIGEANYAIVMDKLWEIEKEKL